MEKVKFPIGAKLVLIITIFLAVSLGAITYMVSMLISGDLELTAEDNNYTINRRSAAAVETIITSINADTLALLDIMEILPPAQVRQAAVSFFEQNPHIAAINDSFINREFFSKRNISADSIDTLVTGFIKSNGEAMRLTEGGKEIILNGGDYFGAPLLVLFYPAEAPGRAKTVTVFFSPESIAQDELSFLVNDSGDILVPPFPSPREISALGGNLADHPFVKSALQSKDRNIQTRYTDTDGQEYFAAFRKLSIADAIMITQIKSSQVFAGIVAATRRNIIVSAAVLLISIFFILIFSNTISSPLRELTAAAEQIKTGNYHLELKNKRKDETGVLTASFISMSHGLGNFERFTNKSLARLALNGKLSAGGTDKTSTILFSDIRSFTAISENMTPGEVVEFINAYMERMVACVFLTGGIIDKFIGDAVMAHWGAVESNGSPQLDALAGVKSALLMRASLRCLNRTRENDGKSAIKIGCGINSGQVVAGQIGADEHIEYTVIGDTVSFADRTETFNKPFGTEILITENTFKLCGSRFITEEMPAVTAAGIKTRIFAVINLRDSKEAEDLLLTSEKIPKTISDIARQCIGAEGPKTMDDVRSMLGIPAPDLSKVNTDEDERKYTVNE
jgi:adenylate cyclase